MAKRQAKMGVARKTSEPTIMAAEAMEPFGQSSDRGERKRPYWFDPGVSESPAPLPHWRPDFGPQAERKPAQSPEELLESCLIWIEGLRHVEDSPIGNSIGAKRVSELWSEARGLGLPGLPVQPKTSTQGDACRALDQLRVWCESFREPKKPDFQHPGDQGAVILSHGSGCYSVAGGDPVSVTGAEDAILVAFMKCSAMDMKSLEGVGGTQARKVLKNLKTKYGGQFSAAIRLPGGKGMGGYSISIEATNAPQ